MAVMGHIAALVLSLSAARCHYMGFPEDTHMWDVAMEKPDKTGDTSGTDWRFPASRDRDMYHPAWSRPRTHSPEMEVFNTYHKDVLSRERTDHSPSAEWHSMAKERTLGSNPVSDPDVPLLGRPRKNSAPFFEEDRGRDWDTHFTPTRYPLLCRYECPRVRGYLTQGMIPPLKSPAGGRRTLGLYPNPDGGDSIEMTEEEHGGGGPHRKGKSHPQHGDKQKSRVASHLRENQLKKRVAAVKTKTERPSTGFNVMDILSTPLRRIFRGQL